MMRTIILFLAIIFAMRANGQFLQIPSVEIGYVFHKNKFNNENYLNYKFSLNDDDNLKGINLKLIFPTKIDYVDFILGTIIEKQDVTRIFSYSPGLTSDYDYLLNGGGVYFGVRPKLTGKYFGITSEFAIGVFTYKQYTGIFNNQYEPFVDEYVRIASNGLGALSSVGCYVKFGRISINPSINVIFSGGDQASFLFYGYNLPISYQF